MAGWMRVVADRFSSLAQRDFRNLWLGGVLVFVGVQMQFFLRGILAWELTERSDALGLVFFVFGGSLLVSTPLGGVATDRLAKRTVLLASQVVLSSSAGLIGLAVLLDVVAFWMLLAAAMTQGIAFGFAGPARVAMASDIVGRENLGNAISLQSLAFNGTRVFAPSLAGALVGWSLFGLGGAYLVAATMNVLGLALTAILPNPPAQLTGKARPFKDVADGVRYVAATPAIRNVVLTTFAVLMFGFSYLTFIPALVEGEFGLGEQEVGLFTSAGSVGALLAAIWVAGIADSPRAPMLMTVAGVIFGVMIVAVGLAPGYLLAAGFAVVGGAGTTVFQTLSNTLALTASTPEFQGRVQSIMQLGFAGFGLASLPLGVLAEQIGLRPTLMIMGAMTAVSVLGFGLFGRAAVSKRISDDADLQEVIA